MNPTPSAAPPSTTRQPLVPPDEQFWKRYSPHHEFPLSNVTTLCVYVLIGVVLYLGYRFGGAIFTDREPLPVEPITLGGGGDGGEGGNNGRGDDPNPPEDIPDTADKLPEKFKPRDKLTDLPHPKVNSDSFSDVVAPDDMASKQYFDNGNLAVVSFGSVQDEARKKLMEGLRGKPGRPGEPGGDGPGPGGKGKILNDRQKRVLRWTMLFDTTSGRDYLQQLGALKAFVAVPTPNGYMVIRDLNARPAAGKVEDLKELKRIFWVDNRPDSVRPLAEALGVKPAPDHLVAFFPQELEDELLKKELKFNGLKEDEIKETRFRVMKRGNGYVPIVVEQTKN
jgi:hypothetical protein